MGKKVPRAAARLLVGHTFCKTFTPSLPPSSCLVASLPKVQTKLERCGVSRSDWVVDLGAGVWIYKEVDGARLTEGARPRNHPSSQTTNSIITYMGFDLNACTFPFQL